MILSGDFILVHPKWQLADDELVHNIKVFNRLVDVFVCACALGIKDDKIIPNSEIEYPLSPVKSISRSTIGEHEDLSSMLDLMLQNAIINSRHLNYDVGTRLKLAFDPDYNEKGFSPNGFMISFANYGIEQIFDNIHLDSTNPLLVAQELENYFSKCKDLDIDNIIAGISLEEIIEEL